jgi:hypothetical protein
MICVNSKYPSIRKEKTALNCSGIRILVLRQVEGQKMPKGQKRNSRWSLTCSITCAFVFLSSLSTSSVRSNEIQSSANHKSNNNASIIINKDMLDEIKQARNPRDLIMNCKTALEKNLFLEEQFKSDEFLLRFAGGSKIDRFDPSLPGWRADIIVYPLSDKSKDRRAIGIQKAIASINVNSDKNGTLKYYWFEGLGIPSNSEFNADLVRAVLGLETSLEPWYHNRRNKVHSLGNTCMHYKIQDEIYDKEMSFYINFDGNVSVYRCTIHVFLKK